jgi:hypothetical protein
MQGMSRIQGGDMTHRTRRRIVIVTSAPVAALAAWTLGRLAGVDFAQSAGRGTVGPADVVGAAIVGGLGAWYVVRTLERHTARPGFWWPWVGTTVLGLSLIGPSYLAGGVDALALGGLHIVTAMVLIWGLETTLPAHCEPASGCAPGSRA